jgi:hypothetical protein
MGHSWRVVCCGELELARLPEGEHWTMGEESANLHLEQLTEHVAEQIIVYLRGGSRDRKADARCFQSEVVEELNKVPAERKRQ